MEGPENILKWNQLLFQRSDTSGKQVRQRMGEQKDYCLFFIDKELNNREIKVRTEAVSSLGTSPSTLSSLQNNSSFWKKKFYSSVNFYGAEREADLDQTWDPESQWLCCLI